MKIWPLGDAAGFLRAATFLRHERGTFLRFTYYVVSCSHVEHELTDRLSLVVSSSWRWQLWWTYKCYIIFKCLVRELNIAEISRAMLRVASLKTSDLCAYTSASPRCVSVCRVNTAITFEHNILYAHKLYVFWKNWWPWPLICWLQNDMASCSSQGNLCAKIWTVVYIWLYSWNLQTQIGQTDVQTECGDENHNH